MTDFHNRLEGIKDRIKELARLAGSKDAGAAHRLAEDLLVELGRLSEAAPPPEGDRDECTPSPHRVPRDEVVRCPRCALRGYTFQKGTIRDSASGHAEGFYRCTSCGHEGWREID